MLPAICRPTANVVITPTGESEKETAALARAKEVESVLRSAHAGEDSLLSRVRTEIALGLASYYLYVSVCVFVLLAVSTPSGFRSLLNPLLVLKNMGLFLFNIVTLQFGDVFMSLKQLATAPWKLWVTVGGFVLAYLLMLYADRRMSAVFSQFWHQAHPKLRDALKRARDVARGLPTGKDTKVA